MIRNTLTVILVALVVYLDVTYRALSERLQVLEGDVTSQQQLLEAVHSVLVNHRNNLEAILGRLENLII
jgi:uncharacterized coiled-coil protein SlyX